MKMSNRILAAYSVGLNRTEMAKHCPTAKLLSTTELKNFRLAFRGGNACAVATIEKKKGGSVPALLWELTPQDEVSLDRRIGVPDLYRKDTVKVRLKGAAMDALVYILIGNKPPNKPCAFYYSTLLEGYKAAGFDTEFLKAAVQANSADAATS